MEVLYSFKGELNNLVLKTILQTMEDKMGEIGVDRFVRKKINSILIECLQNLIFHAEKARTDAEQPSLVISRQGQEYMISTANLIPKEKQATLKNYIDKINAMSDDDLRNFYQEVLTNGKFNPQGGAGLGIINIARKTKDHKLGYKFLPVNDSHLMFQMDILV
jgi:hypothetical protein